MCPRSTMDGHSFYQFDSSHKIIKYKLKCLKVYHFIENLDILLGHKNLSKVNSIIELFTLPYFFILKSVDNGTLPFRKYRALLCQGQMFFTLHNYISCKSLFWRAHTHTDTLFAIGTTSFKFLLLRVLRLAGIFIFFTVSHTGPNASKSRAGVSRFL